MQKAAMLLLSTFEGHEHQLSHEHNEEGETNVRLLYDLMII